MKYQEALEYLNDKSNLGSRLGLDTIRRLLDLLDNPQDKLKFIHIGGTNGKGSTSSYISYGLKAAGYKVGLFTSPHLERYNESIQINHEDIPDNTFGRLMGVIREKANIMVEEGSLHPTSFEIITALSFLYFLEEKADYVVLEVGLGGRNDSTNIISTPLATVFTTIDYDHIDVLGSTLSEIAYEKAGIIKDDTIVISYPQELDVQNVIQTVAKEKKAELNICPIENISIKKVSESGSTFDFTYGNTILEDIEISMLGEYQVYNASLAITTLLILRDKGHTEITHDELKEGLLNAKLKGRLEVLRKKPTFIIDGAHNLQGARQLKKAIKLFNYNRLILGMGILKDKDVEHMVEILGPLADEIILTEVDSPRKLDPDTLAKEMLKYNENIYIEGDNKKAIERALEMAGEEDLIVFSGSLYLIGKIRSLEKLL